MDAHPRTYIDGQTHWLILMVECEFLIWAILNRSTKQTWNLPYEIQKQNKKFIADGGAEVKILVCQMPKGAHPVKGMANSIS